MGRLRELHVGLQEFGVPQRANMPVHVKGWGMKIRWGKRELQIIAAKEKVGALAKRLRAAVLGTVSGKILQK